VLRWYTLHRRAIVVLQHDTAERDGQHIDLKAIYLLGFVGDRIASVHSCSEDDALLTAFWG
jgi:hypothetical protein